MPKLFITLSFFSILFGCTTVSRLDSHVDQKWLPPEVSFLNKWKKSSLHELAQLQVDPRQENIFWWKTYTLGLKQKETQPTNACQNFQVLSEDPHFPLRDLALLHAYETCADKSRLSPLPANTSPWYKDLFLDVKIAEAALTPDLEDDLAATIEKARAENNKKKKEEYLKKSLEIAQSRDLKEHIATVEGLLFKNSPRLNPNPSIQELSAVAMDYRFYRQFDKALEVYQQILDEKKNSTEEHFNALKNVRQTFKVAQRRNDYIKATAELVNWTKAAYKKDKKDRKALIRYHDALVLFAKTLWTEDQTSRAIQTLKSAQRELKGLYPMDEVYFILGRIEEEQGRFLKAIEWLEASYQEPISVPGLRDKNAWLKSWNYYKLEKWSEARTSFQQMRDTVKEPSDKARARFWLARTLKKLNLQAEAVLELESVIKEDSLGYYGVLATRELGRPFTGLKNDNKNLETMSLLSIKELDPRTRLVAEWLIALNEAGPAEKLINAMTEDLKKQKVQDENTWLTVASAYARTGLYLPLFSAIGSLPPAVKDRLLNDHPDLLFPQPFEEIIKAAANKSGTPSEFIYSIIRQESAFNPEARSPVDAFGLMQLLPSVAHKLAKQNSLQYQEAGDLLRPEINIPLGAFELKTLMNKYQNKFILAVSGYNANDDAIRGWLRTRYRPDSVEFIEEVPYEETRTYIKLVMRNYVFYRRLLNPTQEAVFPEELLKL